MKLLIIDDDPETIKLLEAIVRLDGHETFSVLESRNALSAVESFKPDLVLLDIMMPEIDGLELLRRSFADGDERAGRALGLHLKRSGLWEEAAEVWRARTGLLPIAETIRAVAAAP